MEKRIVVLISLFVIFYVQSFAQLTSITYSSLPIMKITTNGNTIIDASKVVVDMGLIYNGPGAVNYTSDASNNYNGKIAIEIRGSSSSSFPQKSYGFETRTGPTGALNNNVSLLGMPTENDWILHAPWTDKTLMRNVLSYKLWNEMGHYGPRTRFIELIIDNVYQGVYVLTEKIKIDQNRVDLASLKAVDVSGDQVTGGYIIKVDKTTSDPAGSWWTSNYTSATGSAINFIFHDPKYGVINSQQQDYIKAYMKDTIEKTLKDAGFADPNTGYQKYMSISSWVDYLILNEISKNVDGYRISAYFHKNKFSKGGKFKAGPAWDYNIAWYNANYYNGEIANSGFVYSEIPVVAPSDGYQPPFWWSRLMSDPYFVQRVNCRYQELRTNILKTSTLHAYIDQVVSDTLSYVVPGHSSSPQSRHFSRWSTSVSGGPLLSSWVWPNAAVPGTYAGEITNLKNWITNRLNWLDQPAQWGAACALPVNLTSFTGHRADKNTVLEWKTVFERNMRSYLVEYSTDGHTYNGIGEVTSVNSSAAYSYSYTHHSNAGGLYRLKMFNDDGTYEYSEVIGIEGPADPLMEFETYPNPFGESITFGYTVHKTANLEIELINATGNVVESIKLPAVAPGHYTQTMESLSQYPAGTYLVKIRSDNTALLKKVVKY